MIGDTAALGASGEVTTQAVAIAQVERRKAWLRRVFLYSRSNGEVWDRTGVETFCEIPHQMWYGSPTTFPDSQYREPWSSCLLVDEPIPLEGPNGR